MLPDRSLVFVYNVDSETLPKTNDHMRMAMPGKETCGLLALTFSPIGMKKEWRRFVHTLDIPARFLSRDEFLAEFRTSTTPFPAVFLQSGNDLFVFISADEINQCARLEDLISLIQQRLTQIREKTG
jgi:hypothetical protein